jgi:hypothetical protein
MVLTDYSIECNIIALVYINRITVRNHIAVNMANWRGLWLGAIILAQKVWDDKPLKTSSFCAMIPDLKREDVIAAEMRVFSLLDYSTTVRPSVYAKYFFELHELFKEITGNNQGYHWTLQPLSIAEKRKLELRSQKHGKDYRETNCPPRATSRETSAPVGEGQPHSSATSCSSAVSSSAARRPQEEALKTMSRTYEDATFSSLSRYVIN